MADNDAVMDVILRFKTENQGAVDQAKKKVDEVGKTSETSARLGERAFSRMGRGISTALSVATNEAGSTNKALADSVRVANQLGQAAIFGGAAGLALTGIALGIGKIVETSSGVSALNQQLDQLGNKDQAQRGMVELTGVTDKQADAMLRAAAANPEFARTLKLVIDEAERAKNPLSQVGDLIDKILSPQRAATAGKQILQMLALTGADVAKQIAVPLGILSPEQAASNWDNAVRIIVGDSNELRSSANENATALVNQADSINENNRLLAIAKQNLPQLVAENKNYTKSINDLKTSHDKAQKAFDADAIMANARATESLEMATRSYGRSLSELARGRGREIEDDARARTSLEKDVTKSIIKLNGDLGKEILRINKDVQEELRGINQESVDGETTAVTYAEVLKIRKRTETRRQEAIAKATQAREDAMMQAEERRKEIEENKRARLEEMNFQKARRDEDYVHQRELLDRSLNDSREATQKALTETLRAIETRRVEENAAYDDNRKKASADHAARIKELTDTRTEEDKLKSAADSVLVSFRGWAPAIDLATAALRNMNREVSFGQFTPTPGRLTYGYQHGGFAPMGSSGIVGEGGMERISVTPRGTMVTPMGGGRSSQPIVNVYIGNEKLDARIDYRVDHNNRGL